MLAYFCVECAMHLREAELLPGKRCPECKRAVRPRMVLCGMVMGDDSEDRRRVQEALSQKGG